MGLISRTADLFYAFRFLKLLVTPWEKTGAFEQGMVRTLRKVGILLHPKRKKSIQYFID